MNRRDLLATVIISIAGIIAISVASYYFLAKSSSVKEQSDLMKTLPRQEEKTKMVIPAKTTSNKK